MFDFGSHIQTLSETRQRPQIPASAVFVSAWAMFATGRGSLNSLEKEARIPARLRGLVGSKAPSADTMGLVYSQLKSEELRRMLSAFNHQVRRNKALGPGGDLLLVAVDGHEFFASRKRCCPDCQTREIQLKDRTVTEYYHRGVVCHLIGHGLALPFDVELQRPGEGEETTAKRLLERVFIEYERFIDVVTGDALYFDAPFINFCLNHHKHVVVVVKGDHRLLLQDAQQLFSQRTPDEWTEGRRTIRFWDEEGFTSCEDVKAPCGCCTLRKPCGAASSSAAQRRKTLHAGIGPPRFPRASFRRASSGMPAIVGGTSKTIASIRCPLIWPWIIASDTKRRRSSTSP